LNDSPDTQESTMNTMTTATRSTHPRGLIAAAILTSLISSFGAVCNAADATEVRTTIVKYADLDVSTPQGAATLYNRIRFASEGVCSPSNDRGDFQAAFRWQKCVKQAITGAVAKVNQPALSAVYAAKYGVLQPAKILTADRR
jgi:UrcA family protein